MLLTKKFTFDCAHKLINYDGQCKNLHGHTYSLFITVEGEVDEKSGMVIDFGVMKNIVKINVVDVFDHAYINDIIAQPTAENMASWIWNKLHKHLNMYKIELWETPDSFVTYCGQKNNEHH